MFKTGQIMRFVTRFITIYITACLVAGLSPQPTLAQPTPPPDENEARKLGAYREVTLDIEVKVQGGTISVYRSWEGDKKTWTINPQHEPLELSDETQGSAYGNILAKEISRGPRKFSQEGTVGLFKSASGSSAGSPSGGGGGAPPPAVLVSRMAFLGVDNCSNDGERAIETLRASEGGYKWVNGVGRRWAQYDINGSLTSWGVGNFKTAEVLRDVNAHIRGYADTRDTQVITIDRDAQSRIIRIADNDGNQVLYSYNAAGLIENVTDTEGVVTHYEYSNGNIIWKRVGDSTQSLPGEAIDDETRIDFTYFPGTETLSTITTPDGTQESFEYQYDSENELYITTVRDNGNKTTRTTENKDGSNTFVERNGEYQFRIVRLCEDTAIIDQHNRVTYIDRDLLGAIKRVIFPDDRALTFEHSRANWPEVGQTWSSPTAPWGIISVTTPDGRFIQYDRDQQGNIKVATENLPNGTQSIWHFDYDTYGNKRKERLLAGTQPDDAKDQIKEWIYDLYGNVQYFREGINGAQWQYLYNARGDLKEAISPKNESFKYFYNGKGKLTRFLAPNGYEVNYSYTKRGLLKQQSEKHDSVAPPAVTKYKYNHRGLVTKIIDPLNNEWQFSYTNSGELREERDPLGKTVNYQYDPKGRVTSVTDANGVAITYNYFDTSPPGPTGQPQAPQISFQFPPRVHVNYPTFKEELQYDLAERLVQRRLHPNTTANSGPTQEYFYSWDNDNRLKSVTRPDGQVVNYTWDNLSRPVSITTPGWGSTRFEYSEGQRKIKIIDPLNGETVYLFDEKGQVTKETRADQSETNYQYDANGNLEFYTSALGDKHRYYYDEVGQAKKVEIFSSSNLVTPVKTVDILRNLRGDVTKVVDGTFEQSYQLDSLGRIQTASTVYNGQFTKSHSYSYFGNSELSTHTSVDGEQYSYIWDPASQLQGIVIPSAGSISIGYTQQDWYQPRSIIFPGGNRQNLEYDDLRRVKKIQSLDQANTTLLDRNYSYQPGSTGHDTISAISTEHGNYSYQYDPALRLTSATNPSGSTQGYTYDDLGRRSPSTGPPWAYNILGAVTDTTSEQYTYDADGNRKTKTDSTGTEHYFYNQEQRLIRIEKPLGTILARYEYDYFGRRLSKEQGGAKTYYYYTEDGLSAELDASGNIQKKYLLAPGSEWGTNPLAQKSGGQYQFYHNDHLGTPLKMVNSSGAVTWEGRAEPFGKTNVLTNTATNNLRLPGQYFDAESGLHHNFQRNYDPRLGAYMEQDPYGVMVTGPNRYHYAMGDPLSLYDPTGEFPWEGVKTGVRVVAVGSGIAVIAGATAPLVVGTAFASGLAVSAFDAYECYQNPCLNWDSCIWAPLGALQGFGAGKWILQGSGGVKGLRIIKDERGALFPRTPPRTQPRNLTEQLTMEEAKAGAGREIMKDRLKDPKFALEWVKMHHSHNNPDGTSTVIHYMKNIITGETTGYKFK